MKGVIDELRELAKGSPAGEVIDCSFVNPDLPPPRLLLDRLLEGAMKPTAHRYSVSRGIPRLRSAFADLYARRFQVSLEAEAEVCVTLGTKDAVLTTLQCVCEARAPIVVVTPLYPAHRFAVELAGGELVEVPMGDSVEELLPRLVASIEERRPRVVLLNFPHNPTGVTVTSAWWRTVIAAAQKVGALVVNDFVYGEMTDAGCGVSLLAAAERHAGVLEVYSLSKSYNIPGWRIAAIVGDEVIVSRVAARKSRVDYGQFLPLQHAAACALESKDDLAARTRETYRRRVHRVSSILSRNGFTVVPSQGGMTVWCSPRVASPGGVAHELARQHGIVTSPGRLYSSSVDIEAIRVAVVLPERLMIEFERRMGLFGEGTW